MKRVKLVGLLIVTLILVSLYYPPSVYAASGTAPDQEVGFGGAYVGIDEEATSYDSLQHDVYGVNWFSQLATWTDNSTIEIYQVEIYGFITGSPPNPLEVHLVYDDGGGDPDEPTLANGTTSLGALGWYNVTISPSIVIDNSGGSLWIVYNTSGGDPSDHYSLRYETTAGDYDGRAESSGDSGATWAVLTDDFAFKLHTRARNEVNETSYAYYWDDDFQYNLTGYFPHEDTGKYLNVTYPRTQRITNITRSNGGLWDTVLASTDYSVDTDYNGTHDMITIPHATIESYGESYRLFTQTHNEYYTLEGLTYENGTDAFPGTTQTVTVFHGAGENTFTLNGTYVFNGTDLEHFRWQVSGISTPRMIDIIDDDINGTVYIYEGEDTYLSHTITIYDYTGAYLPGWGELYRYTDGTLTLLERRIYTNDNNAQPYIMVTGGVYLFRFRSASGLLYDFGTHIAGSSSTTKYIDELEWGDQFQTVWNHITLEALRPNATHIQLLFTDTGPADYPTTHVNMTATYRNGTQAYNTSSTAADIDSLAFNWYGADNETDYVVTSYIVNSKHGTVYAVWVLDWSRTFDSFLDLDVFGTWGGLDVSNIMALVTAIAVMGTFSFVNARVAPFLGVGVLAIFTYLGGASFTSDTLYLGGFLSVVWALISGGRG